MKRVKGDLLSAMNVQWQEMKADLAALRAEVRALSIQERSEVTGSVQIFANLAALPPAGQVGRVAATADTKKLYFDDGNTWLEVPKGMVVARATRSATQQSIPNATLTVLDFDSVVYDTHSAITTGASWVFTAPVAGYYRVDSHIQLGVGAGWADLEFFLFDLYKNSAFFARLWVSNNHPASSHVGGSGGANVYLAVGDTIQIMVNQASGAAINTFNIADLTTVDISLIGA